uniref:Arabinanase/levansucrase/invertase n=1 Tax=Panagrolaimus davidi TaxID=227884 RepID=A0A914P5W5_9BILA
MLPLVIFFIWLQLCSGFISSDDAANTPPSPSPSSSSPSTTSEPSTTPPSTMPPLPTLPTSAPITSSITYKVAAQRVSNQPILSKDMGSFWDFNYNAALFQKDDEIGLFVRVQNLKDENAPLNPGPSYLAVSKLTFKNGQVSATKTTHKTMNPLGSSEAGGTEDPRITCRNGVYYLFYTAYDGINKAVLSSAVSANPFEPNSWIRLSEDLPLRNWSKSGAALFASKENGLTKDYLFWGDSSYSDGIQIATGEPGKWGWKDYNTYLLKKRDGTKFFDSELVESGPSPLKLNTGDYLFIYNSARAGYYTRPDWNLEYNLGYAILAGTDPTQVLDRSKRPLMSPELDWEIGDSNKYLKPNVVFLEGLIPDPDGCKYANVSGLLGAEYIDNAECFFGVYGAADTALGAVRIIVSSNASIVHPSTSPSPSPASPITIPTVSPITGTAPTLSSSSPSTTTTTPIPEKKYKVVAQRISDQPIISFKNGSVWNFNYNAAIFKQGDIIAVLIRVQNLTDQNIPFKAGPSHFAVSMLTFTNGIVTAAPTINNTLTFMQPFEACGTEDPRITYNNGLYYLFYTSNDCTNRKLSSAISINPAEPNSWIRYAAIDLPVGNLLKSGAPLFSDNSKHPNYLFWSDNSHSDAGIGIAVGVPEKLGWNVTPKSLLKKRNGYFDSEFIESGSSPLKLKTGDYLFLYNGARTGYPSVKLDWDLQYNIGYAILSGNNSAHIFERSDQPILSPQLDWEIGNTTDYLKPNVVFLEGLIPDPDGCKYANVSDLLGDQYVDNAECFFGVYGAADSHLGAVRIIVSTKTPLTSPPPTTTALPTTTKTASITTTAPISTTSAQTSSPVSPVTIPTVPIAKTTTKDTPIIVSTSTVSEASVSITSPTPPPTATTTTSDANTKVFSFLVVLIVGILSL